MKWKRVLAGAACVLTMAGGVAYAQKIVNPDWASRPDGSQVAEAYPPLAMQLSIEGRSTLSCSVTTEGRLRNCVAMGTTPPGLGFDSAALKLAESFRMTPKMEDGRPRPSGTVNIPIRFVLPEDAGDGEAPHPGRPTSPEAAALAARLAPFMSRGVIARQNDAAEIALEKTHASVDQQTKAEARRAIRDGTRSTAAAWGRALADAYATTMTEPELKATLEFLSSPGDLEVRHVRVLTAQRPIQEQFVTTIGALARDKFCTQSACGFDRWQPPKGVALINPPWSRQPTEHDIENMAPPMTNLFGLAGWAQINCIAHPSGGLDSCIAVRESPAGLHFGDAALQLSDDYEIDAARLDKNVAGETVAVLINFKPPSFRATAPEPAHSDKPQHKIPSAEAMNLARRIVQADLAMQEIDRFAEQLKTMNNVTSSGGAEFLGATAFVQAFQESRPALVEQLAKTYAFEYTPDELRLLLDFRLGPGGQAVNRLNIELLDALERFHGAKAAAEARRLFCAGRECEPAAAKAAAP